MKPKQIYIAFLLLVVSYFGYSLYAGKLFYEFSTTSQWDSANTRRGFGVNRFYHK